MPMDLTKLNNRDNATYSAESVARLAERHQNLIGYNYGRGDVEQLVRARHRLGDRLVYIGDRPTSEVFACPTLPQGLRTTLPSAAQPVPFGRPSPTSPRTNRESLHVWSNWRKRHDEESRGEAQ